MNTASQDLADLRDDLSFALEQLRQSEINLVKAQQAVSAAQKEVAAIKAEIERVEREIRQ